MYIVIYFDGLKSYSEEELSGFISDILKKTGFKYFGLGFKDLKQSLEKTQSFIYISEHVLDVENYIKQVTKLYPELKITASIDEEYRNKYTKIYATNGDIEICKAKVTINFPARKLW